MQQVQGKFPGSSQKNTGSKKTHHHADSCNVQAATSFLSIIMIIIIIIITIIIMTLAARELQIGLCPLLTTATNV